MKNSAIADTFEMLADLLEFQGANPFRLRAYRNASKAIRDLQEPVEKILKDPSRSLQDIDGIGKAVAEKSAVLVETGSIPQLEEILEEIPRSILDILRIPKLGPKKAKALYDELGITSLEQLKAACEAEQVRTLKGFAAKTEEAILAGMEIAVAAGQRIYWSKADEIADSIREHFSSCEAINQLELAGSYRRGKETVGDLDILVDSDDASAVMDRFAEFEGIVETIGRGGTKMSVRLDNGFQMDLRVVPEESFGAALQYFTGSKEHNVVMRGKAKQMGLKVNEWGIFRVDDDQQIAGKTEEEVYKALDLPWFPPEMRENRGEYDAAEKGKLPKLIELSDIKGDLHMHTTATDGKFSIREMAQAAKDIGLKYIAITDHSKRMAMANGLDEKRLLEQWTEVDEVNEEFGKSFTVLKGIECDILEKGGMDLSDEVLEQADWVLAAVHMGQQQSRDQITSRILGAIENPNVCAIAHPTGRLINRREAYDVDLDAVFSAAKEHKKILELNANPARLDLNEIYSAAAKSLKIPIVINTDAHSIRGLSVMQYGIKQARRAGLTKGDVLNTKTWNQVKKAIGKG